MSITPPKPLWCRVQWRLILPLLVLLILSMVFLRGLWLDPKKLPSARIGQAAPAFTLPDLYAENTLRRHSDLQGKVWVLNVFASWCGACVAEHTQLMRIAANSQVPLVGLAYKDAPQATRDWLRERGNPYQWIAVDQSGRVGIDYGVYGVPETYVIDAKGIIRYRHVGPIDELFLANHVTPVLEGK